MADVIRRHGFTGDPRDTRNRAEHRAEYEGEHRADEIGIHHRERKPSSWPIALLGLLAVGLGLFAFWRYANRPRLPEVTATESVQRVAPATPAPETPPAQPQIAAPAEPEPEAKEPGEADKSGAAPAIGAACSEVKVYFAANETALTDDDTESVTALAECLKANPDQTVQLEGRADPRGSDEHNYGLARGRAESVAGQLTELGVPASQVTTVAVSEQLCSETAESCWQENRSVSVAPAP